MRRDRPRARKNLATLNLVTLRAAQKNANVVARLTRIQQLAEHLDTRAHRLRRRADTHDLDLVANLHDTALHTTRHNRAAPRNREHVLDRHQKRTVNRTLRRGNVRVDRRHQLQNRLLSRLVIATLHRRKRRAADHRNVVPGKTVLRQKLANLKLHKLEKLLVVYLVNLVEIHHNRRNTHLARQKNVLARLRHRTVRRTHNKNRTVHLRGTRDHVLHVVRMARAVDMSIVALLRLVLDMRRVDRDPALTLLGSLVNRRIIRERGTAPCAPVSS